MNSEEEQGGADLHPDEELQLPVTPWPYGRQLSDGEALDAAE